MKVSLALEPAACLPLALSAAALSYGCVERGEVLTLQTRSESRQSEEAQDPTDEEPANDGDANTADEAPHLPSSDTNQVSCSTRHTCAILSGKLWCWGDNASGQLGQDDADDRFEPTLVGQADSWLHVEAGQTHTCALNTLGEIWCWGGNDRGQLGQGDRQSRARPSLVALPQRAAQFSSDWNHSCALLDDDTLHCWGENHEGQLGQGDPYPADDNSAADALDPVRVGDEHWRVIDTGQGHTCGIQLDGTLWCWGRNSSAEAATEERTQFREPVLIGEDTDWRSVDAGQSYTCALRDDDSLWCWGSNVGADIGEGAPFGVQEPTSSVAPFSTGSQTWDKISTDTFHSCGRRGDEVWCWGRGIEGQLGLGDHELRYEPHLAFTGALMVDVGRFHSCLVAESLEVKCTGAADDGKLGTGDGERRNQFTTVLTAD